MALPIAAGAKAVKAAGKKALSATRRGIRTRPVESVVGGAFLGDAVGQTRGYSQGAQDAQAAQHPYPRGY